jgi:hypothetical protein
MLQNKHIVITSRTEIMELEQDALLFFQILTKYVWSPEKRQWQQYVYAKHGSSVELMEERWITADIKEAMRRDILRAEKLTVINGKRVCKIKNIK